MEVFQQLGKQIEQNWRDKNYSEELFPSVAAHALRDFGLPEKVSAWDTVNWALGQDVLPEQRDLPGRFGDPPITLYNSPRFHIDIYFWLDGTTSIHQHAFCGAFQVIHGSSIHSSYEFETKEAINTFTELGDIILDHCELLKIGDVRKILPGREFIHALFHLDQPSATIVVRTHRSPLHLPQFDYRKPFLAVDPFFDEPNLAKKMQSLLMLYKAKHPDADTRLAEMLEKADFQSTFTILANTRGFLRANHLEQFFKVEQGENRFDKMFEIVKKRHGKLADSILPIYAHQDKIQEFVSRRSYVTNPEHRFFFALLLNVDGKERIFSLVKERFSDAEPIEKILDWTTELAQTKVMGLNIPNALGVANFDDFDSFILEDILKGVSDEEIQKNLVAEMSNQNPEEAEKDIAARIEKIRNSAVLKPIL
jgi:uncharacterized protein YaaQ